MAGRRLGELKRPVGHLAFKGLAQLAGEDAGVFRIKELKVITLDIADAAAPWNRDTAGLYTPGWHQCG
jgi:hypothetical protein